MWCLIRRWPKTETVWAWGKLAASPAPSLSSTWSSTVVETLERRCRPLQQQSTPGAVLSTLGGVPSTPEGVPSTSAAVPSAPVVEPTAPAVDPTTSTVVPSGPAAMPTTPTVVPSGPAALPTPQAEQGGQGTPPLEFTSPPSDISEFVDAFHYGKEVRFRRLDNIVGNAEASGLASRLLDDPELLLVSAKEPPTSTPIGDGQCWKR